MRYNIVVKPGSKKGPLVEKSSNGLTVYLRERPIEGAANQALIKILSEYFNVSKSQVIIKAGIASRRKIIEIIK